jgi:hypothetical protein
MQDHAPSATEVRPNFVLAAPDCPICKSGMRFVRTTPVVFASVWSTFHTSVTNAASGRNGRLRGHSRPRGLMRGARSRTGWFGKRAVGKFMLKRPATAWNVPWIFMNKFRKLGFIDYDGQTSAAAASSAAKLA